jgi:hypothetical protein
MIAVDAAARSGTGCEHFSCPFSVFFQGRSPHFILAG